MTDNDKRTIFGFPVASIEFVDKGRDAELARLRAALAEARADVSRFEAALDVANRELAEARREQSIDAEADVLDAIQACVELAEKAAQLEAEQFVGVLDCAIADNWRDIRDVRKWLSDQDAKRSGNNERSSRRTIRALVVAARAMWYVLDDDPDRVRDVTAEVLYEHAKQQAEADRRAGKE